MDSFMIALQSTSALRIGATRTLVLLLLASLAACISSPPRQATGPASASQIQSLEARARAAAKSGDPTAAELYAQLAASTTGTQRIDYLIESARAAITHGDVQVARRRLNDAKAGANRDQQQAITVQSARLELGDRKPQAALDLLATVQQPTPAQVQSDAAAVRADSSMSCRARISPRTSHTAPRTKRAPRSSPSTNAASGTGSKKVAP